MGGGGDHADATIRRLGVAKIPNEFRKSFQQCTGLIPTFLGFGSGAGSGRSFRDSGWREVRTMARPLTPILVALCIGHDTKTYDMKAVDEILGRTSLNGFGRRILWREALELYFKS